MQSSRRSSRWQSVATERCRAARSHRSGGGASAPPIDRIGLGFVGGFRGGDQPLVYMPSAPTSPFVWCYTTGAHNKLVECPRCMSGFQLGCWTELDRDQTNNALGAFY